jgi:allophanate hydrolase subunit 1|tara:strand:- start:623 stop:763 length:141 start_codon:yes stop_codon:yes gene_type:complete
MFDPSRVNPSLVTPGDYIRFVPIESEEEYTFILDSSAEGKYEVEVQ